MAKVHIYRSYRFLDKDPVIDKCRRLIEVEGLKWRDAALMSDMSPATLDNWFNGETRKPQFSSVMSLTRSLGYDIEFKRQRNNGHINVEDELAKARAHREKMTEMKKLPERVRAFRFA